MTSENSENEANQANIVDSEFSGGEPAATPRKGLFARMFDRETRFGRFMRAAVRTVAVVIGLFALGVLVTYLVLYRPMQVQYNQSQTDLSAAETELVEVKADLESTQGELETTSAALEISDVRLHLANISTLVATARFELADKDAKAATQALKKAQDELETLMPFIKEIEPDVSESIVLRLDLALSEVDKQPKMALSDLEILSSTLALLDEVVANQ